MPGAARPRLELLCCSYVLIFIACVELPPVALLIKCYTVWLRDERSCGVGMAADAFLFVEPCDVFYP